VEEAEKWDEALRIGGEMRERESKSRCEMKPSTLQIKHIVEEFI